jgi:hypothetical protein
MDPLEFHAKYNRLERKHRRVEKELADLRAEVGGNRAAPTPSVDFYSPPPKPAQGRGGVLRAFVLPMGLGAGPTPPGLCRAGSGVCRGDRI